MGVMTKTAKASMKAADRAKKAKAKKATKKPAKKTAVPKNLNAKQLKEWSKKTGNPLPKKLAGMAAVGGAAAAASKGKNNGKAKAAQTKRVGKTARELKKLGL